MVTIEDLARRVQVLEDERELRALMATYAFHADLGSSRAWVELFTEDGAVDLGDTVTAMTGGSPPPGYPASPRFQGSEQLLLDFITALPHRRIEGRSQHHTVGPLVFDIGGDESTARGYSLVITRRDTDLAIEAANFNRWRFRRVDGRWKIVERAMRPIGSQEVRTLFAGVG
jgi:SnoaL-like domain